jgi:hypothetical protein
MAKKNESFDNIRQEAKLDPRAGIDNRPEDNNRLILLKFEQVNGSKMNLTFFLQFKKYNDK